ncbi:hypothetical protein ACPEEZ_10705 [Frigoribacterium sp. 2-23]|uniref:hypothetical protein n=1 Tax=Frigoribacterium sp. 2-23 TaxID=3415006 RepID=UPI003C700167
MRFSIAGPAFVASALSGVLAVTWGLAAVGVPVPDFATRSLDGTVEMATGWTGQEAPTCAPRPETSAAVETSAAAEVTVATAVTSASSSRDSDLAAFAQRYAEIRAENCLDPIPTANIRFDACQEQYLTWIKDDPSGDPLSAWGHKGQVERSDGVPPVGCDGNLAGGPGDTGATSADKWWESDAHRASLYRPTFRGDVSGVCIGFAAVRGGVPDDGDSFVRASARWYFC